MGIFDIKIGPKCPPEQNYWAEIRTGDVITLTDDQALADDPSGVSYAVGEVARLSTGVNDRLMVQLLRLGNDEELLLNVNFVEDVVKASIYFKHEAWKPMYAVDIINDNSWSFIAGPHGYVPSFRSEDGIFKISGASDHADRSVTEYELVDGESKNPLVLIVGVQTEQGEWVTLYQGSPLDIDRIALRMERGFTAVGTGSVRYDRTGSPTEGTACPSNR